MDDLLAPDALRSFDVPGDPAACRDSAGRLRRLGHGLEEAAGFLARQGRVSPALAGLAATAYRRRCRQLGEEAVDLSRRTALLGRGLADLADDLARAQDLMGHAERLASAHGLVLGGLLVAPGGPPSWAEGGDPAAWEAWSRARSRIRRARTLELDAQQAWSRLLRRHLTEPAGTDLPAGPPRREPVGADGRDRDRPRDPERGRDGFLDRAPGLDPVTCGLTPGPLAGINLPGVLGRRSGAGVDDRATY